jgi:hypothetical protein
MAQAPKPSRHTCKRRLREALRKMPAKKRSEEEQVQEESGDKKRKLMRNNLTTYFSRQVSGYYSKTTEEDRKTCKMYKDQYQNMAEADKLEFAKAFQSNKQTKNVQWMKDFSDSLVTARKSTETAKEKYMTRTFALKGYMHDAMWSVGASPIRDISWGLPPYVELGGLPPYAGHLLPHIIRTFVGIVTP